jgi:hypothetical protein
MGNISHRNKIERDISMSKDIKESGLQGGKVIGDKLSLFSFIIGIPLLIIGLYGLLSMMFNVDFPFNMANIILIIIVISIGLLMTIGGYAVQKNK